MGRYGPLPHRGSSESKRGRNTFYRKGPARDAVAVAPPDDVKRDPAALAFWEAHAPALVAAKRLRPEHAHTFAVVCHVAAECQALAARVAAELLPRARHRRLGRRPEAQHAAVRRLVDEVRECGVRERAGPDVGQLGGRTRQHHDRAEIGRAHV